MGIGNARRQVIGRIRHAQSRNILIGTIRIASCVQQQALQVGLRPRVVDELGLQARQDFHRPRDIDLFMGALRVPWRERRLDHLSCERDQGQTGRTGR